MSPKRAFLWGWIGGLVAFAIVVALSLPLVLTAVPRGIIDHQAAGTAMQVDRIHSAWALAGVYGQARTAMLADLAFIGIYGVGSVLGGRWFMRSSQRRVRLLGMLALGAGVVFLASDYAETISQLVQLVRHAGDDRLARLAALSQPVKAVAWLASFGAIAAALILERKLPRAG